MEALTATELVNFKRPYKSDGGVLRWGPHTIMIAAIAGLFVIEIEPSCGTTSMFPIRREYLQSASGQVYDKAVSFGGLRKRRCRCCYRNRLG